MKETRSMPFGGKESYRGYGIDVIFCIDVSASMADVIDRIKRSIQDFGVQFLEAMEEYWGQIDALRVKIITFRNFNYDHDALNSTRFFILPDENAQMQSFIDSIEAVSNSTGPQNALEALAEAMNSEWTTEYHKKRHFIVLFTNSAAVKLEDSAKDHEQYPQSVPASLADMQDWWEIGTPEGSLSQRAKRLLLCAPEKDPWDMIKTWNYIEYCGGILWGDLFIDEIIEMAFERDYYSVEQPGER